MEVTEFDGRAGPAEVERARSRPPHRDPDGLIARSLNARELACIDQTHAQATDAHRKASTTFATRAAPRYVAPPERYWYQIVEKGGDFVDSLSSDPVRIGQLNGLASTSRSHLQSLVDNMTILAEQADLPRTRQEMVGAARQMITSLEALIGSGLERADTGLDVQEIYVRDKDGIRRINRMLAREFQFEARRGGALQPLNAGEINLLRRRLDALHDGISTYLRMVDETVPHDEIIPATQERVRGMREAIAEDLLGPIPPEQGDDPVRHAQPRYLLHLCNSCLVSQQGAYAPGLRGVGENVTKGALDAAMRSAASVAGRFINVAAYTAPEALQRPDQIDRPLREIRMVRGDGPDARDEPMVVDHTEQSGMTLGSWLNSFYSFFTGGDRVGIHRLGFHFLASALTYVEDKLNATIVEHQTVLATGERGEAGRVAGQALASNERTLDDVQGAIAIVQAELQNGKADAESNREALNGVRRLMRHHPVWLNNFFQFNPAFRGSEARVKTQEELKTQLERSRRHEDFADELEVHDVDITAETKKLSEISGYMGTFQTVTWLMGEPSTVSGIDSVNFAELVTGVDFEYQGQNRRVEFTKRLCAYVDTRTDCSWFTRFLMKWVVIPITVRICSWASSRFMSGTEEFIKARMLERQSPEMTQVDNSPLDRLTNTAKNLGNAKLEWADQVDSASEGAFVRKSLVGTEEQEAALYDKFTVKAVDEFFIQWTPAQIISDWSTTIQKWVSEISFFPVRWLGYLVVAPVRIAMFAVNWVIVKPIQGVVNFVMNRIARSIATRTQMAKTVIDLTERALCRETDYTAITDEVTLQLLDSLWKLLTTEEEHNSEIDSYVAHGSTNEALKKCLNTLFDGVELSKRSAMEAKAYNRGARNFLENVEQSFGAMIGPRVTDGVVEILNRSYQILMGEKMQRKLLYLTLQATTKAMIAKDEEIHEEEKIAAQKRRRDMIDDYTGLIIWEAVNIATESLERSGCPDVALGRHAGHMKEVFLGQGDDEVASTCTRSSRESHQSITAEATSFGSSRVLPEEHRSVDELRAPVVEGTAERDTDRAGLINKWRAELEALQLEAPAQETAQAFTTRQVQNEVIVSRIFTELQTEADDLRREISAFERSGEAGEDSIALYLEGLGETVHALTGFQKHIIDLLSFLKFEQLEQRDRENIQDIYDNYSNIDKVMRDMLDDLLRHDSSRFDSDKRTVEDSILGIDLPAYELRQKGTAIPGALRQTITTIHSRHVATFNRWRAIMDRVRAAQDFIKSALTTMGGTRAAAYITSTEAHGLLARARPNLSPGEYSELQGLVSAYRRDSSQNRIRAFLTRLSSHRDDEVRTIQRQYRERKIEETKHDFEACLDHSRTPFRIDERETLRSEANPGAIQRASQEALGPLETALMGLQGVDSIQFDLLGSLPLVDGLKKTIYRSLQERFDGLISTYIKNGTMFSAIARDQLVLPFLEA